MKKSIALLAIGVSTGLGQAGPYAQCGGKGWTGDTTCSAGYTCVYNNEYYSQCTPAPVPAGSQQPYGQCGGRGWTGLTQCSPGYSCVYNNDYYSQCVPSSQGGGSGSTSGSSGPQPTSTAAASSTKTSTSAASPTSSTTKTSMTTTKTSATPTTTTKTSATSTTPTTMTTSTRSSTSSTSAAPTSSTSKSSSTSGTPTTTKASSTTSSSSSQAAGTNPACPNATKFKYYGVNEAGAEFGQGAYPGVQGQNYMFPQPSSIDFFIARGYNTFRIPYAMERLSPNSVGGSFASDYLNNLKSITTYITNKGGYAVLDPHNYGRYYGNVITDTTAFGQFCKNVATQFLNNANVIFDTNNEYHDMDQQLVFNLNQQCINGIRSAGATQLILVEGNAYTGAWTWTSSGNAASLVNLVDPGNNMAYEMHQYLDSDGSGTNEACVSSTVGAERIADATRWCQQNNKKCFLGETGGGSNDQCIAALKGELCTMQQAGGVWIGALWWAAGPWWGSDYFLSIEPPNGKAIPRILPEVLDPFK